MSSNLVWRPEVKKGNRLSNDLKLILRRKWHLPYTCSESDFPYIEGLKDAGVDGAEDLLSLILIHKVVILSEEYE